MATNHDQKALLKIAQLHQALKDGCKNEIIDKILEKEGDINYAVPVDVLDELSKRHYIGYTALHFACRMYNKHAFMSLLNLGADFTKKNEDGKTVLHMLVEQQERSTSFSDNSFLDSVFGAHITRNNFSNLCNKDGLTHFHIACIKNYIEAVQFFLDNGIPVDEPVPMNSKFSPGYAPLHFAAMHSNPKVAKILLAFGADMYITDASGKTPLHTLIECRMAMFDSLGIAMSKKDESYEKLQAQIQDNEQIINMLLENMSSDNDCLDSIGLSNFHVACMLLNTSIAQDLADQVTDLNQCINEDSPLWPGYTAMHFAAHFSISTVEMLIKKGASVESKDAKGSTPLDICIQRYKIDEICSIMSLHPNWENILFSDNNTRLLSVINLLADSKRFKKFIENYQRGVHTLRDVNMQIPMESPLWPGYTLLHLAVLFAERTKLIIEDQKKDENEMMLQIIRFCLIHGADLNIQDSQDRTALHLAFRLNKITVVEVLFRYSREMRNMLDQDCLSHLHIACAVSNRKVKIKKFILNDPEAKVNATYKGRLPMNSVRPGSTPLHVYLVNPAIGVDSTDAVNILLKHGADVNIKDFDGLTPIHLLLHYCNQSMNWESMTRKLLKQVTNDCVAEKYGINYLHVACRANDLVAAERFLNDGADVNLAIRYTQPNSNDLLSFLSRYNKFTPFYMSLYKSRELEKLLIDHGADVFVKTADSMTTIIDHNFLNHLKSRFEDNIEIQQRMGQKLGWTKLHLACESIKSDGFQDMVESNLTDVNARISSDSSISGGCTPLHILMSRVTYCNAPENIYNMSRLLLENGADVTVIDDKQNSPIGSLFSSLDYINSQARDAAALLMKYQRNFNVNPVNAQGISHFHIACYVNDVDAVKEFLSSGVDVNYQADLFGRLFAGYTPLHLASNLQVVELLINHRANVHIEDVHGCNSLHEAVKRNHFEENVIMKIIECGAEINTPNFKGKMPFESAISISAGGLTLEKLTFFIRQGFLVNSCNPVTGAGYISTILRKYYSNINLKKLLVERIMNEKSTFILGRTTLHHLVTGSTFSSDGYGFLAKLINLGHDIDEQDSEGKTALYLACEFSNAKAVGALLYYGADINVFDRNGNTVLSHACSESPPKNGHEKISDCLAVHAWRLAMLKIDLNEVNKNVLRDVPQSVRDYAGHRDFVDQVNICKEIKIGVRSFCLFDFLSETDAVAIYPSLNQSERCKIDQYFETLTADDKVTLVRNLLKLQHRKAVLRLKLIGPTIKSFRLLLGFDIPDLCAENIFYYLRNTDLTNIMRAETETLDMEIDMN